MCTVDEKQNIKKYVENEGNLIIACDTEMYFSDPTIKAEDDLASQFGFHFEGDTSFTVTPVSGQENHPLWQAMSPKTTLTQLWDGYISAGYPGVLIGVGRSVPAIVDISSGSGRVIGIGANTLLDLIFTGGKINIFFDYMTS
jgi:uncharacterized membrane-anchored protein YitT (DUF2179 family)